MSLGYLEIMILLLVILIPVVFIYKYAKQKGRLQELEKQQKNGMR